MIRNHYEPLLNHTLHTLFPNNPEKTFTPLNNPAETQFIYDVLSRKDHHHLLLKNTFSPLFTKTYLQNIAQFLAQENLPFTLKHARFIWLDYKNVNLQGYDLTKFETDIMSTLADEAARNSTIILALRVKTPESFFKNLLKNPQWRLIFVVDGDQPYNHLTNYFSQELTLTEPSHDEIIKFLTTYKNDLEKFHQTKISEECIRFCLQISNQFLSAHQPLLEKTIQLLDSSCARASILAKPGEGKPQLDQAIIAEVAAQWTQIPVSHLQRNKMKAAELINALHKTIYGQEAALNLIGLTMQHTSLKLINKPGPVCNFLFAGPANVGKSSTAFALAEQIFGHNRAILQVNFEKNKVPKTLSDIKVFRQNAEQKTISLLKAIQETPSAVILLENFDEANVAPIFEDIFIHGMGFDENNQRYDFKNAIFILTSTLGAERIISLTKDLTPKKEIQSLDLMSLVMNQTDNPSSAAAHKRLSPQELCAEIMPALESGFSALLLRHFNVIPFVLLDYEALEKITRQKLKIFANGLEADYGIELTYAPEAIRYLVQECLWHGDSSRSIDKILEQHLYACVAQELLNNLENSERSNQMHLQLNDTGQLLRCVFVKEVAIS